MSPVLLDSNILIDIFTGNPAWRQWSRDQLTWLSGMTRLHINPVLYSEISMGFDRIEELDVLLEPMPLIHSGNPYFHPARFLHWSSCCRDGVAYYYP